MPRRVDHAERRAQIVQATWRLIAEQGIEATTMRGLARELGLANGSITHYFPHKAAILSAAFQHVFDATNSRYQALTAAGDVCGLAALRVFTMQTLPLDDERMLEARIVIAFLEHAATDEEMTALYRTAMGQWSSDFARHLTEAQSAGEIRADLDLRAVSDLLLNLVTGVQATGVLLRDTADASRMTAMIDGMLAALR